jgi:hypothetical protein
LANGRHLRGVDGRCRRFSRLLLPELRRRGHSLISLLAAGDPALAKLENRLAAKPKIVVPAVTLDGVDDPLKPDGRHVAPFPSCALTQTDGAAEVSPSLMPAGMNRAGSRGGNASVMVAAESFERVSALAISSLETMV